MEDKVKKTRWSEITIILWIVLKKLPHYVKYDIIKLQFIDGQEPKSKTKEVANELEKRMGKWPEKLGRRGEKKEEGTSRENTGGNSCTGF